MSGDDTGRSRPWRGARGRGRAPEKWAAPVGVRDTRWIERSESMSLPPRATDRSDWFAALQRVAAPEHALGALLGLAAGDAFGTTNEFRSLDAPAFPELAAGPQTEIVGGGPFGLEAGEVTDDTQMATALSAALAYRGTFGWGSLVVRYLEWARLAFDIGTQTHEALLMLEQGCDDLRAARIVWEDRDRFPAGNGSLMRTAALGVMLGGSAEARRPMSMAESAITHFDPRCQLACAAFNDAIAHALRGGASAESTIAAAEEGLSAAAELAAGWYPELADEVASARADLAADLAAARADDPALYGDELHLLRMAGFVRVAFRLAFWELAHAPTYRDAIVDAGNRGGDADTNAAIVGALLGAVHGVEAIPEAWRRLILAAPGLVGPRWEFHPRVFLRSVWIAFGKSGEVTSLAKSLDATWSPDYRKPS